MLGVLGLRAETSLRLRQSTAPPTIDAAAAAVNAAAASLGATAAVTCATEPSRIEARLCTCRDDKVHYRPRDTQQRVLLRRTQPCTNQSDVHARPMTIYLSNQAQMVQAQMDLFS